ncbi:MAG TPA: endolytic transglycosylase MltG [Candidatus Saccharimonadales bacterium]
MNDIVRPPKPSIDSTERKSTIDPPVLTVGQPIRSGLEPSEPGIKLSKKRSKVKIWGIVVAVVIMVIAVTIGGVYAWYQGQLQPVAPDNHNQVRITIKSGTHPEGIGQILGENHLIKSPLAFEWYLRFTDSGGSLQAGSYALSQSMSLPEIVEHLKSGQTDTFRITFYPGGTLIDPTTKAANKKQDVTSVLKQAGYSEDEISTALKKTYNHPLFKDKPASADLEGYVYGETYEFSTSATVEQILERTFDEMYKIVQSNNLEAAFKKQGLSLYEGITLASIIQREVSHTEDQKLVAGVFYNRMKQGMTLGSDVTYQYIADKTGVERDPTLDSEYNTRRYPGLPPGPIAAPGESALLAAANPAKSDYLFFLSGDDDMTYFGKTEADHQANIKNHCAEKCKII